MNDTPETRTDTEEETPKHCRMCKDELTPLSGSYCYACKLEMRAEFED